MPGFRSARQPQELRQRRQLKDLEGLPRSAAGSHLYRAAEAASPPNYAPLALFSYGALKGWFASYAKYAFKPRESFVPSTADPIHHCRHRIANESRICLAGDWATGTEESELVALHMLDRHPHFTIHLGDVYYVGDPPEVGENCLGIPNPANNYAPVKWPLGSRGSFALNGNHEMYANGTAYFREFLPVLGLKQKNGAMSGQKTSFFLLENDFWQIFGLDTGYYSVGIPFLEQIPLIRRLPLIGPSCKLHAEILDWLADVAQPGRNGRGVILLTHHQYVSAFEDEYPAAAKQLSKFIGNKPVLWFWGHEHRLAGYALAGDSGIRAHGRCLGHGGMPVKRTTEAHRNRPLLFYDERSNQSGFGMNGFLTLDFSGAVLHATYTDLNGQDLLREEWSKAADGTVLLKGTRKIVDDAQFIVKSPSSGPR